MQCWEAMENSLTSRVNHEVSGASIIEFELVNPRNCRVYRE